MQEIKKNKTPIFQINPEKRINHSLLPGNEIRAKVENFPLTLDLLRYLKVNNLYPPFGFFPAPSMIY
jgi:hypothetical protein